MLVLRLEAAGASARVVTVDRLPFRIGRHRDSDLALTGWRVAREHVELRRLGAGVQVFDLGSLGGTLVNGARITEFGPLQEGDELLIGGHRLPRSASGSLPCRSWQPSGRRVIVRDGWGTRRLGRACGHRLG